MHHLHEALSYSDKLTRLPGCPAPDADMANLRTLELPRLDMTRNVILAISSLQL